MRKAWPFGAAALALVAVLAFPAGASEPAEREGVTVHGTGSVRVEPDTAEWSFAVERRAASASRALALASARSGQVAAAVRAAGVAAEDVQTESVSLWPRTDRRGQVLGYVASASVRVVVRELRRAGAVVDAAVRAGAGEVYGPSLTRSNREELYGRALELAYDEARAKAERLAGKLGVALGRPVAVVEGGGDSGVPYAAEAAFEARALSIEPGRTEVAATVTVTFAVS